MARGTQRCPAKEMPWRKRPFLQGDALRSGVRSAPLACHFGAGGRPDAILFSMAEKDRASGMKSAYELALERMEKQGIERPREETFGDELREKIADVRRKAEARI